MLKILFIGDIVGKMGRAAVAKVLPPLKKKYHLDLVIANGENLAHGVGLTPKTLAEAESSGIDFFTSGNHVWSNPAGLPLLEEKPNLIRPANFGQTKGGRGFALVSTTKGKVLIINLIGRVFIKEAQHCPNPFLTLDEILKQTAKEKVVAKIVDFHAEATSEKVALGFYADGRVSAVLGTHTHVPTTDWRLLPGGTAYLSDVGMVGPQDAVLGANKKAVIDGFLADDLSIVSKEMHEQPTEGVAVFNSVLVEINPTTSQAQKIKRLDFLVKIS